MCKRKKGRYVFLLLLSIWCFAGCSVEELLAEVPQTMQVIQEENAETDTNKKNVGKGQSDVEEQDSNQADKENEERLEEASYKVSDLLLEDSSDYFYDRLSAEEQNWYQDILHALGGMIGKVRLSEEGLEAGLDENCIDRIFQCVLNDHPEIFYVDGYTYTKYSRDNKTVSIIFAGNYQLSEEEVLARKQEILKSAQVILTGIDDKASDYDKVKYVFETIIRNTEYDLAAPDNQNLYSVFVGGASVCQGYAKATQYLLNHLGVESTLVQGKVDNGEGHAWNLVRVDGSYYYVDTTWGDASYRMEDGVGVDAGFMPEINYDYLCVTTEQLLRTHIPESIVPMPECVDMTANYYVRQGALFHSYDKEQMEELFVQAAEQGKNDVTVKCANYDCYQQIKSALIDEQDIFKYLSSENSSISYAHNDKQLSLTFWVTNQ